MTQNLFSIFNKQYDMSCLTNGSYCGAGSTLENTENVRFGLMSLIYRYDIKSMFDGGCGDLNWLKHLDLPCEYSAGDISQVFVNHIKNNLPNINIKLLDITSDPIPQVDLVMFRDVLIHLNNQDKLKALCNFVKSKSKYILMTQNPHVKVNTDFNYEEIFFPESRPNWLLAPWNFPKSLDSFFEDTHGKQLCLWSRETIENSLSLCKNIDLSESSC